MTFIEKIRRAWRLNHSLLCVGLDPDKEKLPACLDKAKGNASLFDFNQQIIDQTAAHCCSFKLQFAYFAAYGAEKELQQSIAYIKQSYPDHLVILDAKRGDIGETAKMYAREAFQRYGTDAVTVNPYMGGDTLAPFLAYPDKGVIVLCRTSNEGSAQFQSLLTDKLPLAHRVAEAAVGWNYNENIMLVVGATYPAELKTIRQLVGQMPLLVPGVGAQGGSLIEVMKNGLDENQTGLLINSSRGIIYASSGADFALAAGLEAKKLNDEMNAVRDTL